jgi:glycosyltransferase involved in cell wall biosynthesis
MERVARRLPAGLVVCSSDHAALAQLALGSGPPVVRVHPGLEPSAPRDAASDGTTVGMLSRLQRIKRVELVLDAAPAVLAAVPAARFVIAGGAPSTFDTDYPAELAARADRLGVGHAVRFVGEVADAQAFVRGLDVLVHVAAVESFGLVYVEAMLAGVPVVAPDHGGGTEIVRDGIEGLLVDVDDSAALAAALVRLLREPALRAQLGAAGRRRATEEFTAERMAAQAWAHVRQLAQAPRAHRRAR